MFGHTVENSTNLVKIIKIKKVGVITISKISKKVIFRKARQTLIL